MFYTIQEITEYRADWLETHPDEDLDTDTIVDCLNDERQAIIEKLIENDMRAIDKGSDLLQQVLTWGWKGYEHMTRTELWDEMNLRSLDL